LKLILEVSLIECGVELLVVLDSLRKICVIVSKDEVKGFKVPNEDIKLPGCSRLSLERIVVEEEGSLKATGF
jgi:hypothetical protein